MTIVIYLVASGTAVWGNKKALITAVFRSKGSCITSTKNQVGLVSPPSGQADGKSGSEAEQSRQASGCDNSTKVIDFSVGPRV